MVAKQFIKAGVDAIAPVAKELTGGDLALKAAVDADPDCTRAAKANTGGRGYGPGSPYRAKRLQKLGPRSTIATRPNKMIKHILKKRIK